MSDFHKNKGDTSVVRLHSTTRVKTIFLVSNFVIFPQNLKYWNEQFWKVACVFHKNKGDTVVYICIPPPPKTYFMKLYVSLCSLDLNHDPIRYRLTLSSALITGHAMHNVHTLDWSLVQ